MVLWYIIVVVVADIVSCKHLKLAVSRLNTETADAGLVTTLSVNAQQQTVLVDTGTSKSFFVWKTWYELRAGSGKCKQLLYGCYHRSIAFPKPMQVERVSFEDGASVGIFPYMDSVRFGDFTKAHTTFGLVSASDPPPTEMAPHASFGLAPPPREGPTRFPSFMDQLMADPSKPISANIFAIYLNQNGSDKPARYSGYLLLGEGDPSVYTGPLKYIPLIPSTLWRARLGFFHVGGDHHTGVVGEEVVIDSGTNHMLVPQTHIESLLNSIRQQASAAAGTTVTID